MEKCIKRVKKEKLNTFKLKELIDKGFKDYQFDKGCVLSYKNQNFQLSFEENFKEMLEELDRNGAFVAYSFEHYIELYDIHTLKDYGVSLEHFRFKEDLSEEEIEEYKSYSKEEKEDLFFEFLEYKRLLHSMDNVERFVTDEDVVFSNPLATTIGIFIKPNRDEYEIYFASYQLEIGNLNVGVEAGSFKENLLTMIDQITQ